MKNLATYILESNKGSAFTHVFKYTEADWDKWVKEVHKNKKIELIDIDEEKEKLILVYYNNKHLATYNLKNQELMTDNAKLFGHEI